MKFQHLVFASALGLLAATSSSFAVEGEEITKKQQKAIDKMVDKLAKVCPAADTCDTEKAQNIIAKAMTKNPDIITDLQSAADETQVPTSVVLAAVGDAAGAAAAGGGNGNGNNGNGNGNNGTPPGQGGTGGGVSGG